MMVIMLIIILLNFLNPMTYAKPLSPNNMGERFWKKGIRVAIYTHCIIYIVLYAH